MSICKFDILCRKLVQFEGEWVAVRHGRQELSHAHHRDVGRYR